MKQVPINVAGDFNAKDYDSNRQIIEYPFVDVWEPNLLEPALNDLKKKDMKRGSSHLLKKRNKITLKNIFVEKDFKIKNRKKLHASFQNNLPLTVYDDL